MESLTKDFFMEATENCPVIPEIINDEWLGALPESDCEIVYIVYGDICTIPEIVEKVKAAGKMAIVHMDLIVGLSSKEISVDFLKKYTKVDGIISMKPAMIKRANDVGLFTIQRFYLMDRFTYANIEKHIKNYNPDIVEFLPAGLSKVMSFLIEKIDRPVVASGLTQDKDDVMGALKAGAIAVATSNRRVWDC